MTVITAKPLRPEAPAAAHRLARLLWPCPALDAYLAETPDRHAVTDYIAAEFRAAHDAHIRDFMPLLLTLSCHGQFSAVAGVRPAAQSPLFLERYLGQPVEAALGQRVGHDVARSNVVEIGNLVATQGGASQLLFLVLTVLLHRNGFDWVVFTGIPPVIKGLEKLGFGLEPLGAADPGCLSATELAHWGSYYDKQPQVVAGNIPAAINTLATHKLYSGVLSLLEPQIDRLAASFRDSDLSFGTHAFSA